MEFIIVLGTIQFKTTNVNGHLLCSTSGPVLSIIENARQRDASPVLNGRRLKPL